MVWSALSEVEGDAVGQPSDWSEPAHWSMGLLNPTDWKAERIGFDKIPESKPAPGSKNKVVINKAIYGVPNNPAKQADVTEKLQAQVVAEKRPAQLAGRDPAFGTKKVLVIDFAVDGKAHKVTISENKKTNLLTGKSTGGKEKTYLPSPHLRKEFEVNGKVARATLYATAQGFAEMYLNGKRVSDEYFVPGWTDYRKRIYYRSYDVTSMLEPGANALGAILGDGWFRGTISIKGQNQ